jgi:hypothetical protein
MFTCVYCSKVCKNDNSHRNHERQCPKNLNRIYKNGMTGKTAWNKGLTVATDERVAKNAIAIKANAKEIGKCKDPEKEVLRRQKLSIAAKRSGFGGYRENAGRSKKFRVLDSYGKETVLQSTYELKCSEILNELGIEWIRPKALKYDNKNYFADFYLPKIDMYLDPKNSYKARLDLEKINKVIEQNNVKVVILLEEHLTLEHIKQLCS